MRASAEDSNGGKKRRIVIAGGGFAGVRCAKDLEAEFGDDSDIELVLVSEDNFLLFTPMLPQVVSGMLETRHIVTPIRAVCKKTRFYEGRIKGIDPLKKTVTVWGGADGRRGLSIHYDYLLVALGSETNFFGMQDVQKNAYTLKTLNDAAMLRNRIIDMLEQAENEADESVRRRLLCFVVAGAGFADLAECADVLEVAHPARLMPDGKQLSGGVLFTTDPALARSFATVLLVGESLDECEGYLREAGLALK